MSADTLDSESVDSTSDAESPIPLDRLLEAPPACSHLQSSRNSELQKAHDIGLPSPRLESWRWSGLMRALPATPFPASRLPDLNDTAVVDESVFKSNLRPWPEARRGDRSPFPHLARALTLRTLDDKKQSAHKAIPARANGGSFHRYARFVIKAGAPKNLILIPPMPDDTGLFNSDHEFIVGTGARLRLFVPNRGRADIFRIARLRLLLHRDASVDVVRTESGAAFARIETEALLAGEGARVRVLGAATLGPGRRAEDILRVRHAAPRTRSEVRIHAAIAEGGSHVFQGRVEIPKGAQDADAKMECKALLLGPGAEARHKPELEIEHDEVQCSHGAASSPLDDSLLFYLRSRGLPHATAQNLAVGGFINTPFDEGDEVFGKDGVDANIQALVKTDNQGDALSVGDSEALEASDEGVDDATFDRITRGERERLPGRLEAEAAP